ASGFTGSPLTISWSWCPGNMNSSVPHPTSRIPPTTMALLNFLTSLLLVPCSAHLTTMPSGGVFIGPSSPQHVSVLSLPTAQAYSFAATICLNCPLGISSGAAPQQLSEPSETTPQAYSSA